MCPVNGQQDVIGCQLAESVAQCVSQLMAGIEDELQRMFQCKLLQYLIVGVPGNVAMVTYDFPVHVENAVLELKHIRQCKSDCIDAIKHG